LAVGPWLNQTRQLVIPAAKIKMGELPIAERLYGHFATSLMLVPGPRIVTGSLSTFAKRNLKH